MGEQYSMRTEQVPLTSVFQLDTNLQYTAGLSSNEAAFTLHPQVGTNCVIDIITSEVEFQALCCESLKEVRGSLDEVNHEGILDCKTAKWKNQQFFELVNDYFQYCLLTLAFCTALGKCLLKARENQSLILHVGLPELHNFNAAGNPFTEDFFQEFATVHKHQVLMFEKLQIEQNRLDEKLGSVKLWRKISNIIFAATSVTALSCSVVAASMSAPHVVAALAAAASIPLGSSIGALFNSLLRGHENELKGQKELIRSTQACTYVAIKDLYSLWVPVNSLAIEIQSLMQNADSAHGEGEALKIAVEEIEKKLEVSMKNIEDLTEQAERCKKDIRRARTVVLLRLSKHPKS